MTPFNIINVVTLQTTSCCLLSAHSSFITLCHNVESLERRGVIMESPHGPLCTGDVTMSQGLCYYCPHDLMFIAHLSNELRPGVLELMGPLQHL